MATGEIWWRGRFHAGKASDRPPDFDYIKLIALAAESAGFLGTLIPTGSYCEDAWLIAAAVAQHTRGSSRWWPSAPAFSCRRWPRRPRLPFSASPGTPAAQCGHWRQLERAEVVRRFSRSRRALRAHGGISQYRARGLGGKGFNYQGQHYRVENGGLVQPLVARPTLYFGGASSAAEKVAAAHADVYLTWGETPPMVKARIDSVRRQADALSREIRFGIRLHVITRDTEEQAWKEAQRLLDGIPPGAIENARSQLNAMESVGQSRMLELNAGKHGSVRDLEVYPNLWAGVGLVRGGAGTALIGSHEQVAERIAEYEGIGLDTFILSAYPNLEEAIRVGEDLLPLLAKNAAQPAEVARPLAAAS